ncbi:hypothetical protein BHF70_02080 [Anaerostipes sp. 494a]|uniref:MerR family transcriptional regulator n=1 Tax=Anaerostipes sp. 494a TaxID=1261636 RepID=UPI000950F172|nr:MerR family transcriptional regulator [Anaerostipes sp. 494a]OLR58512.1 hypothetical protein BHF70_02080 [Anaerostipes sp. 494a]
MDYMKIREICETLEISRRALQGYEKAGLVTTTGRNKYGHLFYDDTAKLRITPIKFYQQLGFTIKEITVIIDASSIVINAALEQKVEKLRQEKEEINDLIDRVNQMIDRLTNENSRKKELEKLD